MVGFTYMSATFFLYNFQALVKSVFLTPRIHLCEPGFSIDNLADNVGGRYVSKPNHIKQGWANYGPRAGSGPFGILAGPLALMDSTFS